MNIGIAGAGIMGRMLAFYLIQAGHHVSIFDKLSVYNRHSASQIAAGMLAPYAELENGFIDILHMANDAVIRWKMVLATLGQEHLLNTRGSLLIAHANETQELMYFARRVNAYLPHIQLSVSENIEKYEQELSGMPLNGILLESEACLDSCKVMDGLFAYLNQYCAWYECCEITEIIRNTLRWENNVMHFDRVFDCRGLGAKDILSELRGVRGELLILHAPHIHLTRPIRLLHPRYSLYVVPRENGQYVVGATQIEAFDDSPVSVQSCLELLSALYAMHPGFAEARIVGIQAQCRPAFQNNLPKIIETDDCIHLNGMYRHGFLLAPFFADQAARLLIRSNNVSMD